MLSPYSISMALTMCYIGSCHQTSKELKDLLCLETLTDSQILAMNSNYTSFLTTGLGNNTSLELANKLYQNSTFKLNSTYRVCVEYF